MPGSSDKTLGRPRISEKLEKRVQDQLRAGKCIMKVAHEVGVGSWHRRANCAGDEPPFRRRRNRIRRHRSLILPQFGNRKQKDATPINEITSAFLMPQRHFPPPWSVEDIGAAFVVTDSAGQELAYVYFEDEPDGARLARNAASRISLIDKPRFRSGSVGSIIMCRVWIAMIFHSSSKTGAPPLPGCVAA
jgi:hypothetical protein